MKISAIIAEYNPFHTGHAHHIAATRAAGADKVIVIMSGNFVQRGEPALLDKWTRTRMALHGGADLVLELPVFGVLSSAEGFARSAIAVLNGLGCVDTLSFGAEMPDLSLLSAIADVLTTQPAEYRACLAQRLAAGDSFPKARSTALAAVLGEDAAAAASLPNNTLALEYLQALRHFDSPIRPLAIPRRSDYLAAQPAGKFASALALRNSIHQGIDDWQTYVLPQDLALVKDPVREDALLQPLLYCLRTASPAQLSHIADMVEGLENRILQAARSADSYTALLDGIKTKRYPMARIKRILLHCLLGIDHTLVEKILQEPPYARVLGVARGSTDLLSLLSHNSRIPVCTAPPRTDVPAGMALDILASDLYALASDPIRKAGADYTTPLIIE